MQIASPYHEGELAVQEAAGEQVSAIRNGRAIGNAIMPGALAYIAKRSLLVVGSVSSEGDIWCSLLTGPRGFVTAPTVQRLQLNATNSLTHDRDPLWKNIRSNPQVGILAIDLATRRRLRINGPLRPIRDDVWELTVVEAYPNCPKYIQRREITPVTSEARPRRGFAQGEANALGDDHRRWIESADTLFVASAHPQHGADASHRGGNPGFVRFVAEHTIRVPDYVGNGMFNTLGNFRVNPAAGLVFVDFNSSRTLQLTGDATLRFDPGGDPVHPTGGTGRYWDLRVRNWIDAPMAHPILAETLDPWPGNPGDPREELR